MKNGNLASWSIEHKQIIYFFMFLCLVAGIYSYNILGRSEDPVYTVKQMVISAAWPGATAKEMEMQVTDKIEKKPRPYRILITLQVIRARGSALLTFTLKSMFQPIRYAATGWNCAIL